MKGSPWNIVFAISLIIIWIIAGVYATMASLKLRKYKSTDVFFERAYWMTFSAAIITWLLIALFIFIIGFGISGIIGLFGAGGASSVAAAAQQGGDGTKDIISKGIAWGIIIVFLVALFLVVLTGVLCAMAATAITNSNNYKPNEDPVQYKAYIECVIGASICLGAASMLLIGVIVYFSIGIGNKQKAKALQLAHDEEISRKLAEIQALKVQLVTNKTASASVLSENTSKGIHVVVKNDPVVESPVVVEAPVVVNSASLVVAKAP